MTTFFAVLGVIWTSVIAVFGGLGLIGHIVTRRREQGTADNALRARLDSDVARIVTHDPYDWANEPAAVICEFERQIRTPGRLEQAITEELHQ